MEFETCAVCLENYDPQKKVPKFLACHHSFCKSCLQSLVNNGFITCPNCREKTKLGAKGVEDLQSNFYILQNIEANKPQATTPHITTDGEDLSWCIQCRSSKSDNCLRNGHVAINLNNEQDLEASTTELKIYLDICKSKWQAAITQRKQAAASLDAIHTALLFLEQQSKALQTENEQKINQLEYLLKGVDIASSMLASRRNIRASEMKLFLLKNSTRASKSEKEVERSSALIKALSTFGDSKATVDVKRSNGSPVPLPLLTDANLGFTWKTAGDGTARDREPHLLTALSYICMAAVPSNDGLFRYLKVSPASQVQTPQKPNFAPTNANNETTKRVFTHENKAAVGNAAAGGNFKPQRNHPQHQNFPTNKPDFVKPNERVNQKQNSGAHAVNPQRNQGAKPKQHPNKHENKKKKDNSNNAAVVTSQMPQESTTSNLGDLLKQAAIEAAINGLTNLAQSLAEESKPVKKKN